MRIISNVKFIILKEMISEKFILILAINMYFRNRFPAILFQAEIIQYQPLFTMLNYSICSLIWDWELSRSFNIKKLHKLRAQTLESLCYFETFNCQWIKTVPIFSESLNRSILSVITYCFMVSTVLGPMGIQQD